MCPKCFHVFEKDGYINSHTIATLKEVFQSNNFDIMYLKNRNIDYVLRNSKIIKYIMRYVKYKIFKFNTTGGQIEYVVKPKNI